jgi:hypothetical protein
MVPTISDDGGRGGDHQMNGILLGILIGLLTGTAVCARYLRQEIAANIGPRLRRIELQLDSLQAELNLANTTRLADLSRRLPEPPAQPGRMVS